MFGFVIRRGVTLEEQIHPGAKTNEKMVTGTPKRVKLFQLIRMLQWLEFPSRYRYKVCLPWQDQRSGKASSTWNNRSDLPWDPIQIHQGPNQTTLDRYRPLWLWSF